MQINANTKLNTLFKFHQGALDAIVSLNEKYEKLRNPFLRKIMAPRTSIFMAAKIGGCAVTDFYKVLHPLGFTVDDKVENVSQQTKSGTTAVPPVLAENIFDARPVLSSGGDPLKKIMELAGSIPHGEAFCIVNTFEPVPLIELLAKRGFETISIQKSDLEFHTFFKRIQIKEPVKETSYAHYEWQDVEEKFKGHLRFVDVRQMSAPLPMITILEQLKELPDGYALHVHHKRVPVHLLPEIGDRGFEYALKETGKDEVHLMIFRAA
ncbi:MAG: DUF2249 domain-containing protein [Chitinophagaceae bacterium]|nr:MAG: DUF2249 domain-containing protein [Chitinophagaceae bacterium]